MLQSHYEGASRLFASRPCTRRPPARARCPDKLIVRCEQMEDAPHRCDLPPHTCRECNGARSAAQISAQTLVTFCNVCSQLYGDFVRRPQVSSFKKTTVCRRCGGTGSVPCGPCVGKGYLPKGGYQKRNPVNVSRVLGDFSRCDGG